MTSNFVNKIFMISRLISKFTKILCHENLELYGSGYSVITSGPFGYSFICIRLVSL